MGRGQQNAEQQVKSIIEFAKIIEMYETKITILKSKIDKVLSYTRILQEGDPDNENPKKILNYIEAELNYQMESK